MVKRAIVLLSILVAVSAAGEFSILANPDSLEFKGNENLDSSLVSNVILSSLGYSIENQENWNGLYIRNPFKLPTSAVLFVIDGVESLKSDDLKAHTFPLSGLSYDLKSIQSRVPDALLIDLENNKEAVTEISETFGEIKPVAKKTASSLKPSSNTEDKEFLNKIAVIDALNEKLAASKDSPNVIVLRLSLNSFKSDHADSPVATAEALDILSGTIAELRDAAEKSFGDDVLVATVATTERSTRYKRQAKPETRQETINYNLAPEYSEDYPVIFNIILWFGVVFFFSLLAISYAIGYMDPGRDSIIYRMTSTRMKKDN